MTGRAAPFYCPYCGDEDLRPFGEKHVEWRCGACRRVFDLKYVGMAMSTDAAIVGAGLAGEGPAGEGPAGETPVGERE
jgi:hypothetical protein